jgi:predicted DNA-binding transcriptional regulator AlpA
MAEWTITGAGGNEFGLLAMDDIRKMLGGIGDGLLMKLISQGRFPHPIKAGPKSPPQWSARIVACWLEVAPMMQPDREEEEEDKPAKTPRKAADGPG